MLLNISIKERIEYLLFIKFESSIKLNEIIALEGGSINETFKVNAGKKSFFVKINSVSKFPGMFEAESKGLNLLSAKSCFKIPEIIILDNYQDNSILILEYISSGLKTAGFFTAFAEALADLHKSTQLKFGLDHDNFIGSIKQSNSEHLSWIDFFIEERLEKQLKSAKDNKKVTGLFIQKAEKIYKRLNELIPEEKPSLLHGDLWSGNIMAAENDTPCVFDPAVYYGHREMDIAMTVLFGGFPDEFYNRYSDVFPLEKDWRKRMEIYNLYPLLVHVNLFGGDYINQVENILNKF
jgi:protein-ribulosamine 3-kinase